MKKISEYLNKGDSTTMPSKYITIEYDEEKYEVEILKNGSQAILKSKLYRDSSEVIHVFDLDEVSIIRQIDKDRPYFITISRTRYGKQDTLTAYYDSVHFLEETDKFEIDNMFEFKPGVFLITNGNDSFIYNMHKYSSTLPVGSFELDVNIMEFIDPKYENTVLVREDVEYGIAKDTITYGLDLDTLELVTNIWSTEQQKYIKKYNTKETKKYLRSIHAFPFVNNEKMGACTIENEVDKYLKLLDAQGIYTTYPGQDKSMYVYDVDGKHILNKEHLKHLRRRYYDENFKPKKNRSN